MTDPTQELRDTITSGIKKVIPSNSPLAQSGTSSIDADPIKQRNANIEAQGIPAAEDNYVQLRDVKEPTAQDVYDPEIPIDEKKPIIAEEIIEQPVSTKASASREVASQPIQGADSSFDKLAAKQDELQKRFEDDYEQEKKLRAEKIKSVEDRLAQLNSQPTSIDNRSLWSKSSTGQKVLLTLGALLSSTTPQSANAFREGIEATINRDINAQLKEIDEKRADKNSLLSQLKDLTGNDEAAAAAFKANTYNLLGQKLSLQAQKAQSNLQRQIALQNYEIAKEAANVNKMKMVAAMQKQQSDGSIQGYEGVIKDPVAAREFRKSIAEAPGVEKEIDNLLNINNKFLGGALSSDARASAKQSQNLLIGKLREAIAGPGTLSEGDRSLLEDAIANPTDFFTLGSSNKIKLQKLKDTYRRKLQADAEAYGLRKVGRPSSFQGV